MEKVIIVTGGTSGIGLNTARILAEKGCRVYEFSRRDAGVWPGVTHVQADVTDEAQVDAAVGTVLERASASPAPSSLPIRRRRRSSLT